MAQLSFTVESTLSSEDAFARLADLTRVSEWDRGITNPRLIAGVGSALGAKYEVTVTGFDGHPTQAVYELIRVEAPNGFTMVGSHPTFRADDVVAIERTTTGSVVSYSAGLVLLEDTPPMTETQLESMFPKVVAVAEAGLNGFLNP